eukprot:12882320-Prorocentrum_lima.AAC.1
MRCAAPLTSHVGRVSARHLGFTSADLLRIIIPGESSSGSDFDPRLRTIQKSSGSWMLSQITVPRACGHADPLR